MSNFKVWCPFPIDPLLIPPRWSPQCAVCGKALGDEITLDIMSYADGGQFRLTCCKTPYDEAHSDGVARHYPVDKYNVYDRLTSLGTKRWVDLGKLLGAMSEWLMRYRLIGKERPATPDQPLPLPPDQPSPPAHDAGHA